MKKIIFGLILFLSCISLAQASEDGRTTKGGFVREGMVLGRGVLNILGSPFELIRTPATEPSTHKWLWPVTSIPRSVTNFIVRATSGVNDILVYPFVAPFTNDISPLTEPMDLPEYVWSRA